LLTLTSIKTLKGVVIGDRTVGKTSLLIASTTNAYPGAFMPKGIERYAAKRVVEDQQIDLQFWCDSEQDGRLLRLICYPDTDIFVICFSLVSPT
jgi:GTPase SAR1 family protein